MPHFSDHPDRPGTRIWKRSSQGAIFSGCAAILCLVGAVMMGYLAIIVLATDEMMPAALVIMCAALVMLALASYVWRDMQGKTGGSIILTATGIELDLKRNRSLSHRSPAIHKTLTWTQVRSLDHRLEGYGAQGLAMMQRSYWLVPTSGQPILLFEDRGIGSPQETDPMMPLAEEMAQRAGLTLVEHGMARGRGGILGAWFAHGPPLGAETLSPEQQSRLWRRVWLTGSLVSIAFLAVVIGFMFG